MDRLLLFDIDATLLLTGGAGIRSMRRAARELFGDRFQWDGVEPSGGLDPLLFAEAARRSGVAPDDGDHAAFRDRYIEILAVELRERASDVRAMPGVRGLLEALRARGDLALGLLTGNYERSAALKLAAIGVDIAWFPVAVFGDEAGSRPELGAVALGRYEARYGRPIAPGRVVLVGDTPKDVHCARANGFVAFGVGTGKYTARDLIDAGAHSAVEDLSDPAALFELLR